MLFCLEHFDFNIKGLKSSEVHMLPNNKVLLNQLRDMNAIFLKSAGKLQINCDSFLYTFTAFHLEELW